MGHVLVLGLVLDRISAILGKISAILVLGHLASILRPPAVDFGLVWAILGRLGTALGAPWAASCGQVAVFGTSWGRLGRRSGTAQNHFKAQVPLMTPQSGLQDAMLCARGAVLCAQGAILCAQGTQNSLKFYLKNNILLIPSPLVPF